MAVLAPDVDDIFAVEFSRDGRLLAAVGENGNVLLWDVCDPRKPMLLGKPYLVAPDEAHPLAISPDSRTSPSASLTEPYDSSTSPTPPPRNRCDALPDPTATSTP